MEDEVTLVISGIVIIAILGWLIGTVLGISRHIDDVKRNLKLEFKVELGKSELKNKYLGKTYTMGGVEYTVKNVLLDEFYISSGLSHIEYIIELTDTNGFIISLNQRQFKSFIEEIDDDADNDDGTMLQRGGVVENQDFSSRNTYK